jgi:hypothetical protein
MAADIASFPIMKNQTSDIPKEIHQTWISDDFTEQPCVERCYRSVSEMNPGWERRFYDDAAMEAAIASPGPLAAENFRKLPGGVEKADAFRCSILHQRGGIYCDIDIEAMRPFDELLDRARREGILTDETEVLLTTDHPIHREKIFGGRTLLMNHFMVARPGARRRHRWAARRDRNRRGRFHGSLAETGAGRGTLGPISGKHV